MGIRIKVNNVEIEKQQPRSLSTGFATHNWTDADTQDHPDRLTMGQFGGIIGGFVVLMLFTGKDKYEINPVEDFSPRSLMRKALAKKKPVAKIKTVKQNFYSNGFMKGASKKLKAISKEKLLKLMSKRKVLK